MWGGGCRFGCCPDTKLWPLGSVPPWNLGFLEYYNLTRATLWVTVGADSKGAGQGFGSDRDDTPQGR